MWGFVLFLFSLMGKAFKYGKRLFRGQGCLCGGSWQLERLGMCRGICILLSLLISKWSESCVPPGSVGGFLPAAGTGENANNLTSEPLGLGFGTCLFFPAQNLS